MGKDWIYAKTVKEMSEKGGPDVWLAAVKQKAYEKGAADMKNKLVAPLLMSGVAIGVIGVKGCQEIYKWICEKKENKLLTEQEAAMAEEYLIKELYDAMEEICEKETDK